MNQDSKTYTPLHVHGFFSTMDGFSDPKEIIKRACELKLHAIALTDHGGVHGCVKFHKEGKGKIKTILGNELYIALNPINLKGNEYRWNTHQVIWSKSKNGWIDLLDITSYTNNKDTYYYKPRVQLFNHKTEDGKVVFGLEEWAKRGNLQSFSGHMGSYIADNLFCSMSGKPEDKEALKTAYNWNKGCQNPEEYAQFLKKDWLESTCEIAKKQEDMFGKGNFFIELQDCFAPQCRFTFAITKFIADRLREVSKECGIPAVASLDPHFCYPEQSDLHKLMLSINLKVTEKEVEKKLEDDDSDGILGFFGNDQFYIHSYDEMREKFSEEELELTNKIADGVESYDISSKPLMPKVFIPKNIVFSKSKVDNIKTEEDKYLLHLCIEGAKVLQPWLTSPGHEKEEYWERLRSELSTIFEAGLSPYLLMTYDICQFADNRPKDGSFDWRLNLSKGGEINPIMRGPSRGSVAGCLVCFMIGVTSIDPLLYNLLFSRFYNKGRNTKDRVSLMDIDCDYEIEERDTIFKYIKHLYGNDNVAKIITFGKIKGRAGVKDCGRVMGIPFDQLNDICNYIPDEARISDQLEIRDQEGEDSTIIGWAIDNSQELRDIMKADDNIARCLDRAKGLEGVIRSKGTHAAGVVIMPDAVSKYAPMTLDVKGDDCIAGFEMSDIEYVGGVKLDILGVSVLSKLKMVKLLLKKRGINLDFNKIPLNEERCWALVSRGTSNKGLFQVESQLLSSWSKRIKPSNIKELSDLISMIRPGALASGQSELYYKRKFGIEKNEAIHPCLEPILKDTYNCLIYQEQAIRCSMEIAGFDEVEGDTLRKALGKKLPEEISKLKIKFIDGCLKVGKVDKTMAEEIFSWIEKGQRYSFCAGHGIGYSLLCYFCIYCKVFFPTEYYCSWLAYAHEKMDFEEEKEQLILDAKSNNISVLPPDIQLGNSNFEIAGDRVIRFGLSHIRGIGDKASELIRTNKEKLKTWGSFLLSVPNIKRSVAEGLIKSGACDSFGMYRCSMIKELYALYGNGHSENNIVKSLTDKELKHASQALESKGVLETLQSIIDNKACTSKRVECIQKKIEYIKEPCVDSAKQKSMLEKIYLGLSLTCSAVNDIVNRDKDVWTIKEVLKAPFDEKYSIYCVIDEVEKKRTGPKAKTPGKEYVYLKVSDETGGISQVIVWSELYEEVKELLVENEVVKLEVKKSKWNSREQIIANKMRKA